MINTFKLGLILLVYNLLMGSLLLTFGAIYMWNVNDMGISVESYCLEHFEGKDDDPEELCAEIMDGRIVAIIGMTCGSYYILACSITIFISVCFPGHKDTLIKMTPKIMKGLFYAIGASFLCLELTHSFMELFMNFERLQTERQALNNTYRANYILAIIPGILLCIRLVRKLRKLICKKLRSKRDAKKNVADEENAGATPETVDNNEFDVIALHYEFSSWS